MPLHPIDIQVQAHDEEIVVSVVGDLDMATSPRLSNVLRSAPPSHDTVVLDLSRVEFMGSSGVATIIDAREDLAGRGQDLVLRLPSDAVQRVLALTGVDELLALPSPRLHDR